MSQEEMARRREFRVEKHNGEYCLTSLVLAKHLGIPHGRIMAKLRTFQKNNKDTDHLELSSYINISREEKEMFIIKGVSPLDNIDMSLRAFWIVSRATEKENKTSPCL